MNALDESIKWCDWLSAYEVTDTEPALRLQNGSETHYIWSDVLRHIEWHARMTRAWMKGRPVRIEEKYEKTAG